MQACLINLIEYFLDILRVAKNHNFDFQSRDKIKRCIHEFNFSSQFILIIYLKIFERRFIIITCKLVTYLNFESLN